MKKFVAGFLAFLLLVAFLFIGGWSGLTRLYAPAHFQGDSGVDYGARVEGKEFQVYSVDGQWKSIFLTGVNLGLGSPGYFPGEMSIQKSDYLRWFRQIGEMNANTIRVYTAQPPWFYEALAEYNRFAVQPLYLVQEVYVDEQDALEYANVYADDGKMKTDFIAAARELTDMIHGNADVPYRAGHAWGEYTADVSKYFVGWILGVEWEPELVMGTNEANPEKTAFAGTYVTTEDASAFEVFLAESAEELIAYESEAYGAQTPIAFCNWVTTDPLRHSNEPNAEEDMVSVDVERILATPRFEAGFFASYHIYPYYPESLNYQADYVATGNPYRAYLEELNEYHTMPVLVAEVGIPSSRGRTHESPAMGYHQGHISETEQGEMVDALLRDIHGTGYMGALVFSWQDEWFKRAWNTMDLDEAERRPYWPDYQTSEQNFGLLAFDPGEKTTAAVVDGKRNEWAGDKPVVQTEDAAVYMRADEGRLYLRVDTERFGREPLYIGIDTIPGQGIRSYEGHDLGCEADFLLILDGEDNSRLLVDAYYDSNYYLYAVQTPLIPRDSARERKEYGRFVPVVQALNRGMTIPDTGQVVPFTTFEAGKLTYGVADPSSKDYNSLADFCAGNGTVELRLPYLLLNISDPSTGLILNDFYAGGGIESVQGDGVTLGLDGTAGQYRWQYWGDGPTWHERLKPAYGILSRTFEEIRNDSEQLTPLRRLVTAFQDPRMQVLGLVIVFLLVLMAYFFVVLIFVHVRGIARVRRMSRLKRLAENEPFRARRTLRSRRGLLAVTELLGGAGAGEHTDVRVLMGEPLFLAFLKKKIAGRDLEQKMLAIDLAGRTGLSAVAGEIETLLRADERQEVQYHGLLALSLLGAYRQMTALCAEGGCKRMTLSYRSLLEIFSAYTGDKLALCRAMLEAGDSYIVRVCVKQAGQEGFTELAPRLMELLDREDFNLRLDAARALGQLKWRNAGEKILPLLEHERWEMRGVATAALAGIDTGAYAEALERALGDSEWQVRFNAATALSTLPQRREILDRVAASGDRYAAEILAYMIELSEGKEVAIRA